MGNNVTIEWSEHSHYTTRIDADALRELLAGDGEHDTHADPRPIIGALSGADVDDGHLDEFLSGRTISDFLYADNRRIDNIRQQEDPTPPRKRVAPPDIPARDKRVAEYRLKIHEHDAREGLLQKLTDQAENDYHQQDVADDYRHYTYLESCEEALTAARSLLEDLGYSAQGS